MKKKSRRRSKVNLRVPNDVLRRLDLIADQADVSVADVVNVLLTLHVVIAKEEKRHERG